MDDKVLRQLQLTMLETLKVLDTFCRKHNIKYSLYAGTLLGAVRHQGFIPWDDDLDVCMSREEYDRFIALWEEEQPEGYILQNKENTPAYWQSFSKIRKDHTTFLQEEREAGKFHTGVFLDIFPLDRMPNGKLSRAIFKWRCMKYQLLTREFVPPKAGLVTRLGSAVILACTPKISRERIRRNILKRLPVLMVGMTWILPLLKRWDPCAKPMRRICRRPLWSCPLRTAPICALHNGTIICTASSVTICSCLPKRNVHGDITRLL